MKQQVGKNENERIQALNSYLILDSPEEASFDRITELASLICDVPISLISLISKDRQWFKSRVGLELTETALNLAFCRYTIRDTAILEVEDASKDQRFHDNELVTGEPKIRFYAGCPLIDPNGHALGTLCVIDKVPRKLNDKQKRSLQILAGEAMSLILEHRQKAELKNFESLFQLSNDLICVAGTDGFFKKVNPAFELVLGWDKTMLLNTSFFDLVHPEDLLETQNEIKRLAMGFNTINFTHRFKTKDVDYKTLQWVATPEPLTGNLFAIARDITAEKSKELQLILSEERARTFFENSQGLMCTHDLKGNFKSVNDAGAMILGFSKEELLGSSLFDIIPESRHDSLNKYLDEIKEQGYSKGQMVTRHKNGSYRIWMYSNILKLDLEGEPYVIGNAVDITERHHLEEALRRTKETLEQTNRVARVGGWEFDLMEQKISWTSVTKEIHGVPTDYEPVLNEAILFYKEGPGREIIKAALEEAIANGTPWDLELQIINTEGREIWIRAIGNAQFQNGICTRIYGTFQDIDESKKAELQLHNSQKLLNNVLQAASEISIIATDMQGLITVFNSGAEKLLGYTANEMIGKQTPQTIHSYDEVHARSRELSDEFGFPVEGFRVFVEKAELLGSEQKEWTYIRKDGKERTVSLVVTAMRDMNDQISGYLGVGTDITERLAAERALLVEKARLSSFVEHAPAAVAMLDDEMRFIAVSSRWLEDYHLKGRQVIGSSYYEVFEAIGEDRKERHKRILNGAIERKEEDKYRLSGDSEDQYVTWEMRPWYLHDNKVGGMMMFTQNITSIILQREELKVAKRHAEEANVAKSEFLANMSHEIRTPLNGIVGFTDLVMKTPLSETQHQYLSIVNQSANALLSIINDILDFSKIEAGKLELDVEKCDLYELSAQATDIITYQVQTKGLEMLLNTATDLPRFIYSDAVRIKQVLVNLLGNSSKFTEKGEIELKIQKIGGQDDQTTLRFEVRDTGIGIKQEKQQKIFEAFAQEDSSTTKKYGGTGLGLTISNKLLGLMGSRLELKSNYGEGSTFYFDVTFKSEQGDAIKWTNIDQVKSILVVDDNKNNRQIVSAMLALKDISTTEAANGFEALQILGKGANFDCVIMDYHMPYMDGLETIRKIRESFFRTGAEQPIILLHSSSDDGKIIQECEELDVACRLIKPIKMNDLYYALSHLYQKDIMANRVSEEQNLHSVSACRVLIAEDNAVNMLLARTIVKKIRPNAKIIEAKNGLEALAFYKKELPDIILMDVQMPEMNGYEATRAIRSLGSSVYIPIVALTAGNVKGEKEKCLASGMDDFVAKPMVERNLATIFTQWLDDNDEAEASHEEGESTSQHFNIEKLKSYLGNDDAIIKEALTLVSTELREASLLLKKYLVARDRLGLNNAGHKLYGTAASSGLNRLSVMAAEMEQLSDFEWDEASALADKIEVEIGIVLKLIGDPS